MNSQQIQYFLAICENQSFSKTANQFYVSQPTVSAQISALEKELDATLFERTRHNVTMTSAGRAYAEFFSESSAQFRLLRQEYSGNRNRASYLSLGVLHAFQSAQLISLFRRYHDENPSVDLRIRSINPTLAPLPIPLLEKNLDAIITLYSLNFENSAISWRPLMGTRFVAVVSGSNPLLRRKNPTLADFSSQTLFVPNTNSDLGYQQMLQRVRRRYDLQHMHTEIIYSIEAICLSVSCGLGVSILLEETAREYPGLVMLDIEEPMQLIAAWYKDNKNPNLPAFLDHAGAAHEETRLS